MKKKFFVLDGSSLLYRAYYALPLLESESGEYTNAIVGFSNMLVKLLNTWAPDYLVIAFDKSKETFRKEMYPEYKGTRKPTPPELKSQIPLLKAMAEAWGIAFIELDGYEADDILGTLANKAVAQGMEAYVVTGDRDALQLVKEDLTVLFTKKGISDIVAYDPAVFQAEYEGLDPIQLIDLKGLMGDTSDNIPGVPKVGPKTAIKLICAYGSVEQVLLHIEEISGKALQERLRDNQQQAVLSKQLATICLDAPVEFTPEAFSIQVKGQQLHDFYARYNMRTMLRQIKPFIGDGNGAGNTQAKSGSHEALGAFADLPELQATELALPEFKAISTAAEGQAVAEAAKAAGVIYLAPAFQGKVPHSRLEALAIGVGDKLYYLQVRQASENGMDDLFGLAEENVNEAWGPIAQVLADGEIIKQLHNLKGFYHAGIQLAGKLYDLELVAYLVNPSRSKYDVAELAKHYVPDLAELDKEAKQEELLAWQVFALQQMAADLEQRMERLGLTKLYWEMELPLVQVLADMEAAGIHVNKEKLAQQTENAGVIIKRLESEIYEIAGRSFNIGSPKQLGEVLFDDLQLPVIKKTKTGYSTNVEVLNELYGLSPIIEKILAYRTWTKLKSTYLDGIKPLLDSETGRVHTSFNQTVTATGRLSSSDPNLQNIPVRKEEGKQIRELFVPADGYDLLLSADYSQIELRVLADMSQDENFLKAFSNQEDVHARTAAEVFGVPMEAVDSDLRRKAKAVNFGIVYGISDYGLSQDLHIPRAEAKEYIQKYFAKCSGVKAFIDQVVADAHDKGYVLTRFGRRRDLPAIRSSNFNQRSLAERMAMNTPIQGTAADIIKLAMIRTHRMLQEDGLKSRILLQVHDELVLEVVEAELSQVQALLTEAMEQVVELSVPLTIDINIGKNWAEAK